MKKLNELDIRINKAEITSIQIGIEDSGFTYEVRGKLIAENGLTISTFDFETDSYNNSMKFEAPMSALGASRELFEKITPVILQKISGTFARLGDGK